ncbi:hypothetical protein L0244_40315 [bacterium]|nr:hypothetical protein [bacterium]
MARKRRRKARRGKSYAKKRGMYHRKRRYSPKRKRSYGRRKRRNMVYANPKRRRHSRGRKRPYRRRRRNPSAVRYVTRKSYGAATQLFSMKMAKNVIAGVAGFAAVNFIEPYVPYVPSTSMGLFIKKGIAAVAAYILAGFVPGVSASQKKYVMYGSAFNIGLDFVKMQFPVIAEQGGLSGFSGYGQSLDMPSPTPARLTPTALIPAVLQ